MRRLSILAAFLLVLAIFITIWEARRNPKAVLLIPTLTRNPEYCLTCHGNLPEISQAHPIQTFGCVICHGGEPLALDAELAHSTLRGGQNPSDLSVVEGSCGGKECHNGSMEDQRDHIHRVLTNLHGTYAGAIATIRYTYKAQSDLIAQKGIYAIQDEVIETKTGVAALTVFDPEQETSAAVIRFSSNCLNCHLSAEENAESSSFRLTGCAACHTISAEKKQNEPLHQLTTAIPYKQCNTCHYQGSYDIRSITYTPYQDLSTERFSDHYPPNTQAARCEWTLDCIDCHTRMEAMGDGDIHSTIIETPSIQCLTCHGTVEDLPKTRRVSGLDDFALHQAFINRFAGENWDLKPGDEILVTNQGESLWNTRLKLDGTYELFRKAAGQILPFRAVKGTGCQQKIDEQDSNSCHTCHQENY